MKLQRLRKGLLQMSRKRDCRMKSPQKCPHPNITQRMQKQRAVKEFSKSGSNIQAEYLEVVTLDLDGFIQLFQFQDKSQARLAISRLSKTQLNTFLRVVSQALYDKQQQNLQRAQEASILVSIIKSFQQFFQQFKKGRPIQPNNFPWRCEYINQQVHQTMKNVVKVWNQQTIMVDCMDQSYRLPLQEELREFVDNQSIERLYQFRARLNSNSSKVLQAKQLLQISKLQLSLSQLNLEYQQFRQRSVFELEQSAISSLRVTINLQNQITRLKDQLSQAKNEKMRWKDGYMMLDSSLDQSKMMIELQRQQEEQSELLRKFEMRQGIADRIYQKELQLINLKIQKTRCYIQDKAEQYGKTKEQSPSIAKKEWQLWDKTQDYGLLKSLIKIYFDKIESFGKMKNKQEQRQYQQAQRMWGQQVAYKQKQLQKLCCQLSGKEVEEKEVKLQKYGVSQENRRDLNWFEFQHVQKLIGIYQEQNGNKEQKMNTEQDINSLECKNKQIIQEASDNPTKNNNFSHYINRGAKSASKYQEIRLSDAELDKAKTQTDPRINHTSKKRDNLRQDYYDERKAAFILVKCYEKAKKSKRYKWLFMYFNRCLRRKSRVFVTWLSELILDNDFGPQIIKDLSIILNKSDQPPQIGQQTEQQLQLLKVYTDIELQSILEYQNLNVFLTSPKPESQKIGARNIQMAMSKDIVIHSQRDDKSD